MDVSNIPHCNKLEVHIALYVCASVRQLYFDTFKIYYNIIVIGA